MSQTGPVSDREAIEAHNELDRWAVPRAGMTLLERVRHLALRYHAQAEQARTLEELRDTHVPDFPPENYGSESAS